jgi:uncharacterized protein with PQ loop repeat
VNGILAIVAMIFVQGSTLFQIVKFVRAKRTEGVSIGFWWAILVGLSFYLWYSITIGDVYYTISNSIGILLSIISISLYYYYKGGAYAEIYCLLCRLPRLL